MNKEALKREHDLKDGFLNFHIDNDWLRCIEYSAIKLSKLKKYKLKPNIIQKSWYVYIECSFPRKSFTSVATVLIKEKINYRILKYGIVIEEVSNLENSIQKDK
ncbi:MAG: hypothetical protein LBQ24_05650 [Candidatus Peribacteria bacterium]|jgi:hypothetical protein|nr:hypothetical protein [Candidatus Peribacteria bacterium]